MATTTFDYEPGKLRLCVPTTTFGSPTYKRVTAHTYIMLPMFCHTTDWCLAMTFLFDSIKANGVYVYFLNLSKNRDKNLVPAIENKYIQCRKT